MNKKRAKINKKSLVRRQKKLFFREIRSRLKRRLSRKARLPRVIKIKYHLYNRYYVEKKAQRARKLEVCTIEIPEKFCFFSNPVVTNEFFEKLNTIFKRRKPRDIFITHENTKEISLSASYLFDRIIKEERNYWQKKGIFIRLSGKISRLKKVNDFLLSFGILNELGINAEKFSADIVDFDYKDKYFTIKIDGSRLNPTNKGKASEELAEYFNNCLRHNGFEMNIATKSSLIGIIGEIIGNAEEHCGNNEGKWHALGCYDKDEHNCSFAIINYGKTFYENLSDEKSTAAEVIARVKAIIDKQKPLWEKVKGKIFQSQDEEAIWTVMALQDGISSKRTEFGQGSTRGQGIMDVLTFIDAIKSPKKAAEIYLISGHAEIIIDYTYPIVNKEVGAMKEVRRIIAFNKAADLHQIPDDKKVIYLENKLEGTIFAGNFRIDRKYLEERNKESQ
ncbi:MAG: hypothetical protein PHP17_00395 [Candidatus Omnitrophica bacterium]|nr:hypothetical protein [Candidatus Omnitrophota bacterium]